MAVRRGPHGRVVRPRSRLRAALFVLAAGLSLCAAPARAGLVECVGDCSGDAALEINELILGVEIAQGSEPLSACPEFDRDGSGRVTLDELVAAVNGALAGCRAGGETESPAASATPTETEDPRPTETPGGPSPTATRTGTRTVTPTRTRVPTDTPEPSATRVHTRTLTPTRAASSTRTASPTASPSRTPPPTVAAATSTPAPPTRTGTATRTGSATRTGTRTGTATRTRTPSSTPSATRTSTAPAAATGTATPTASRTAPRTATSTRTSPGPATATPSRTGSRTRTASPTATGTATRTLTRSAAATRTATPAPPASATRSPTITRTPSRTATATRSATPTRTPTRPPTITPTVPTIGPTITYMGVARADGQVTQPIGFLPDDGTPIFQRPLGRGFFLVIEAKPALPSRPVGQTTFNYDPHDPNVLPNLQLVVSRPLGDGSPAVCDDGPEPPIGGVPAVDPPVFGGTQASANAINDFACRFVAIVSGTDGGQGRGPCTRNANSEGAFVNPQTRVQFCPSLGIGAEVTFPDGDTRVTARVTDELGQPGAPASIIIRVYAGP